MHYPDLGAEVAGLYNSVPSDFFKGGGVTNIDIIVFPVILYYAISYVVYFAFHYILYISFKMSNSV